MLPSNLQQTQKQITALYQHIQLRTAKNLLLHRSQKKVLDRDEQDLRNQKLRKKK